MLKQNRRDRQAGFTLIELMVVVAIIGILAAIGLPQLTNYIKQAETTEAVNTMGHIAQEVQGYIDAHPSLAVGAFQSGGTNAIDGTTLYPAGTNSGGTISSLISTLSIPSSAKFYYTVNNLTVNATTRVAAFCIKALLADATNPGAVYYDSALMTAAGWDGHFYRIPYVKATAAASMSGTNCTTP